MTESFKEARDKDALPLVKTRKRKATMGKGAGTSCGNEGSRLAAGSGGKEGGQVSPSYPPARSSPATCKSGSASSGARLPLHRGPPVAETPVAASLLEPHGVAKTPMKKSRKRPRSSDPDYEPSGDFALEGPSLAGVDSADGELVFVEYLGSLTLEWL